MSARLVTLNRTRALAAIRDLADDRPAGLTKVRVDRPRPLLAVVLAVERGMIPPGVNLPITVVGDGSEEQLTSLERWVTSLGGSLLRTAPSAGENVPEVLEAEHGIDLRSAVDLESGVLEGLVLAETRGAAWLYGRLDHPTLLALDRVMRDHAGAVHVVPIERVMLPPRAPAWKKHCSP